MVHKVIAPLVIADTGDGKLRYFYRGAVVPNLSESAKNHLIERGMIVDTEAKAETLTMTAEVSKSETPERKAVPKPANSATKSEWVEFARSKGMSRSDAEALSKLELVKKFG